MKPISKISPVVYAGLCTNYKVDFTANDIINVVLESTQLTRFELLLKKRFRHIVDARQLICYLILKYIPEANTNNVTKYFGVIQNHATVIHSRKAVIDRIKYYPQFAQQVADIETKLYKLQFSETVGNN